MTELVNFTNALKALGERDPARAKRLGVSPRTLSRYKAGILPPPLDTIVDEGLDEVLEGLIADIRAGKNSTS